MEEDQIDYVFVNAVDYLVFHDFVDQLEDSTTDSTVSLPEREPDVASLEITSSTPSLHRRSISRRRCGEESWDSSSEDSSSSVCSSVTQVLDSKLRSYKLRSELKENEKNLEKSKPTNAPTVLEESAEIVGDWNDVKEEEIEESKVTTKYDDRFGDSVDSVEEPSESSSSSFLVLFAGFVIEAIAFQINLLIKVFSLPFRALYCFSIYVVDPFGSLKRGREYVTGKLMNLLNYISGIVGRVTSDWLMEHKSIWMLFLRFLWGFLWSIYVVLALLSLLVFSVAISWFLVRNLVEEPVEIKEELNFDYTKYSPVAIVPVWSCVSVGCGVNGKEDNVNVGNSKGSRLIPINHKLQVTISLTMPESEYNRNLGIFQVRVDFLSVNGEALTSLSRPCMLKFKSDPVRILSTFLKIVPLFTGYVSESETINLKIRGYTEGEGPTACLKVMLERRAEFKPGAGIPEIYDASLMLQSELSILKRIVWMWRKTIFIWSCIMFFMIELLLTLGCCGALIVSSRRPVIGSSGNVNVQSSRQQQGS